MQDELHPDDAAALREPGRHGEGVLRQQLSNAVVALYKEFFGRGPTSAQTYLEPNLVILVLGGGYTAAEQTLFESGRWHDVREARQAWQDTMELRFVAAVEQITQRTVTAFMSASHQDPDVSVELFVLDSSSPQDAARAQTT
jgi:uncharacterized protein YbcI